MCDECNKQLPCPMTGIKSTGSWQKGFPCYKSCGNCFSIDYEDIFTQRVAFCACGNKKNKYSGENVLSSFICKYWKPRPK
jgi:hypothetical protein